MVTGFEDQYVIIGGTACDLIMENEELLFRATVIRQIKRCLFRQIKTGLSEHLTMG